MKRIVLTAVALLGTTTMISTPAHAWLKHTH